MVAETQQASGSNIRRWIASSGRKSRRVVATAVLATMAFSSIASVTRAATVTDGFESFTGASGSTVAGYSGWTSLTSASAVVNNDGTAYQGSYYLRLLDTTPSVISAQKSFSTTPVYVDGATFSFALRDDADGNGFTNDQVVLGTTGNTALQVGIKGAGTSATFSSTNYTGTTAQTPTSLTGTVAANTWYVFSIVYSTGGTLVGTYSLSITNASTGLPVYTSTTPLSGQTAFTSLAAENITSALVETTSLYKGSADFDSLSLSNPASNPAAPEPASIAGLSALAGGLILRRRRRQNRFVGNA